MPLKAPTSQTAPSPETLPGSVHTRVLSGFAFLQLSRPTGTPQSSAVTPPGLSVYLYLTWFSGSFIHGAPAPDASSL